MIFFYFLIFIMPLSKHHLWGAIAGEFTGIKYIGMVCLPYALFHISQRRTVPAFFRSWQARLFLVLYTIATISFLVFNPKIFFVSHWLSYTSFLAFFFITIAVVDSLPRLRWVVVSGIGAIGLAAAYVVRDWQLYHNVYADYRPGWVVGDPNYFTVDALIFLPVALLLLQQKRPRSQRVFVLGCLAMTVAAIMFSASRGGFLGLVASSLYFLWKSHQRVRNLILLCTTIALLSLPMGISPGQRLLHPTDSDDRAGQIRLGLWSGGLKMIEQHPIFGVGLDNFAREAIKYVDPSQIPKGDTSYRVAHNSYLEITAELGIPCLLMFVGIIVSSVRSLEKVRLASGKSGDEFLQRVALGLQAGIVGASVALFFVSGQYQKMFWLAIFLSACLPSLVRSESASLAAVEPSSGGLGYPVTASQLPLASRVPAGRNFDSRASQELQDWAITTGKPRW